MSGQEPEDTGPIRVLIVDDHPIVRDGLTARINEQPDMVCCGEADSVEEALAGIEATHPQVIFVDISLKQSSGLDLIKLVRASHPHVKSLAISVHDDMLYADRALRAGAVGYLNMHATPVEFIEAIRSAMAGKIVLSPKMKDQKLAGIAPVREGVGGIEALSDRELQVLELIGRGTATKDVAAELNLSVHTIDTYRDKIKTKLGIKGSTELIRRAVQWVMEVDRG